VLWSAGGQRVPTAGLRPRHGPSQTLLLGIIKINGVILPKVYFSTGKTPAKTRLLKNNSIKKQLFKIKNLNLCLNKTRLHLEFGH
jgi:hypothetical protein